MLLVLTVAVTANRLKAADPQLSRITPPGAQRGAEVDVQLAGARLADAQEILLYYPGIRVVSLKAEAANRIDARLAIAPDCRLGMHALRVRTASGISNLKTLNVGSLPEVNEAEPNNDFAQPQKIDSGTTVNGVVTSEDVDHFVVEAKKGERIVAEIEGLRVGDTFFDPYVAVMDTDRFVLAGSDDTALLRQDAVAAAIAPSDGHYVIQVRESAFGGSSLCRYRLHVGRFPRPLAVYPAGGPLGESVEVRYLGDPAGERTETVSLPGDPDPTFGLFAQDGGGIAPSPNAFRLGDLDNVLEAEPNDAPGEAAAFEGPAALNGIIGKPGDVDHFKFSAKKGQVYDVRVHARSVRSPLDSVLTIRRASGANVGSNDDGGSPDSYLRFRAPEDDEYVVSIRDHLGAGGPEYVYRVEVTPVEPRLTLSLPERRQFADTCVAVPRGNRTAVMVAAQREDFGGDVEIELQGLPEGITVETVPMPANQNTVPVLFTAAADAPLAGKLADVIGRHKAGDRVIEGRLRQRTSLVRGQNNRELWNHYADRMAAAVAEAVPFSVEIHQPKVPIVQNGSMELKIKAARKEGFNAPISIRMLYNPPGVSAPTSVSIPADKTEVVLPLTANGSARVGAWKIAVTAQATVDGGAVLTASQLADLEVAEPFFAFTAQTVTMEQGQPAELALAVEKKKDFEGAASVELLGLPNEVTSETKQITKDSSEVVFPLASTEKSPPGHHKGLRCKAVVTARSEPIVHMLGAGELKIFKPLPQKPAEPKAKPKPEAKPKPKPDAPPPKRLSRLEQLRLAREQARPGNSGENQ
ncbi:MAG: PPC domain-containing protein [Planctomycetota bacterium]|jgi:hypothetical protein